MAELTIAGLQKSYGDTTVLADIDLNVAHGEFVVFVGPSGYGKSTLLRLICGLDAVSGGTIAVGGEVVNDVPPSKRGIAMVFQSYALYPHMSVAENMGYALCLAERPRAEIDRRVRAAAAILKIEDYLARKPRQLSGGQRQRVAIGRAIVREPEIFLFDEPLSNLDAALRLDMRAEFARLKDRLGTTMIYVTHDQIDAMTLADRIVVMNAGRIEQVGTPLELYERPANRFVAGFIGSPRMGFLPATPDHTGLLLPGGRLDGVDGAGVAEVGLRPEHVNIFTDGEECRGRNGRLTGRVGTSEHLGSDTFAHVDIEGVERPVLVRLPGERPIRAGAEVVLAFALGVASAEPVEFMNWTITEETGQEVIEGMIERFDGEVEPQGYAWGEMNKNYVLRARSNTLPDVGQTQGRLLPTVAAATNPLDLNEVIGRDTLLEMYDEGFLVAGEIDGRQVGLPWIGGTIGWVANQEVLDAAGVEAMPTTIEEFRAALETVRDEVPSSVPFAMATKNRTRSSSTTSSCHGRSAPSPSARTVRRT